jgi:hypothetical protein
MNTLLRKGPRRSLQWLVALDYVLHPNKRHGLLKEMAYANGMTPSRLSSLASAIRGAK